MDFFAAATPCKPLGRFMLTHSAQNDSSGVDFFAAATPCKPLGRYARNDEKQLNEP